LASFFLLVLAGCSLGPDYSHPADPSPAAWRNQAGAASPWPAAEWWHGFESRQLDDYIAKAQAANFDLAAAMARVQEADAQAQIAGAPLLPAVGLGAEAVRQRQPASGAGIQNSNAYLPSITASYELDFWGKNAAAARAAEQTALSSRYDRETVALSVTSGVATTYFQILALRDRLAVADDNLATAKSILKGFRSEARIGTATALDVAQQETVVANIDASIPPLRQQLDQTVDALAILLGEAPEQVVPGPGTLGEMKAPQLGAGLPAELLRRRPDVASAEAQLIGANESVKVALAGFFPSLTLSASGGFAASRLGQAVNPAYAVYSLTAGLTQPIFEGGALQGQYDYAKAHYAELLADYRKTVLTALGNVEDSLGAVAQTAEQKKRQRAAVEAARRAFTYSNKQMAAGTVNILTVLNTETALFTAQDAMVQAEVAHLEALVALYNALGGGWQQTQDRS
jgi:NodT family efflux transporter outer membrane factor (OMF) lipoprotein